MSLVQGHSRSLSASAGASAPEEALGSLKRCLVEGDCEQLARERRVRHKALAISVVFQVAVLAALVLVPLFGTAEKIDTRGYTPMPPYYGGRGSALRPAPSPGPNRAQGAFDFSSHFYQPTRVPRGPLGAEPQPPGDANQGNPLGQGVPMGDPNGLINILDAASNRPRPPVENRRSASAHGRVVVTTIEPAMLLRKVEPVYPVIAQQIHREGRVELRAIIATDGTIQSLEVLSGDPMFFQSALNAVRQWRYRPTILNGVPFEVETHITVIYTLQH